jgi:hypothetical protein
MERLLISTFRFATSAKFRNPLREVVARRVLPAGCRHRFEPAFHLSVDLQPQELVGRIGRHVRSACDGDVHILGGRNAVGWRFRNARAGHICDPAARGGVGQQVAPEK